VDLQRNKTSLHIVTSVGYSIEYYDARNNKYKVHNCISKSLSQDRHVKLDHCHHSMAYPQCADRGDSQQKGKGVGKRTDTTSSR